MKVIDKVKQAAGTAAGVAVLVTVQRNDVFNEIDVVRFAGIPLFKRDDKGNPSILGIRFRRRRAPRAE